MDILSDVTLKPFRFISVWLFAGTSASASQVTLAAERPGTAPTPARADARMRWASKMISTYLIWIRLICRPSMTLVSSDRAPAWRTSMELLTANVLEVSPERIANQNQSLPTLPAVRKTLGSGKNCLQRKSSPGITGAVIFVILLVLLIWMICVRATRVKKPEKHGLGKKNHQQCKVSQFNL